MIEELPESKAMELMGVIVRVRVFVRFSSLVIMNTGVPSPVFDFRGEENGRQDLSTGKVLIGVITLFYIDILMFFFLKVSSFHCVEVIQFVNGNSPSC